LTWRPSSHHEPSVTVAGGWPAEGRASPRAIHTVPKRRQEFDIPRLRCGCRSSVHRAALVLRPCYLRAAQERIDVPGSTGRGSPCGHRLSLRCRFLSKKHSVVAALFGTPVSMGQFDRLVRSRIVTVQGLEHAAKTLRSIPASVCQPSSLALHLALLRSSQISRSRSRLHPLGLQ
jgi:hypothetical protein